jgi:uncharacterized SAM-dependent methyltransferase
MPNFKVQLWEQVSVWQQVKVVIKAESEAELEQKLKSNSFVLEDCFDADPDWNTEAHLDYDTEDYALLATWENKDA